MRNACKRAVLDLMSRDEDVVLLTADGHDFLGELPPGAERRFIDYGIAEQAMIAGAAGLASCGKRPGSGRTCPPASSPTSSAFSPSSASASPNRPRSPGS